MKEHHDVELAPADSDDDTEIIYDEYFSVIDPEDSAEGAEVIGDDRSYVHCRRRRFARRGRFAGELAASGAGLEEAGA